MKKLITIIIVAGLALTIQAQDITNKLGQGGKFEVVENDGTTMFSVTEVGTTQTPNVIIGDNANSNHLNAKRQLNIVEEGGSAGLNLYSYRNGGWNSEDKISLFHANGSVASPKTVSSNNEFAEIAWYGHHGSWNNSKAAAISVKSGTVTGSATPGNLIFSTSNGGSPVDRMTIKSDGVVNIAGLSGTGTEFVKVDASGNLVRSATKAPAPINNQIQQLKEENAALKAEMAELRKMMMKLQKKF